MNARQTSAVLPGDELCTITLTWSQALQVMGSFKRDMKRTEQDFVHGVCSVSDLETENEIAAELQRQILFRLPPSVRGRLR